MPEAHWEHHAALVQEQEQQAELQEAEEYAARYPMDDELALAAHRGDWEHHAALLESQERQAELEEAECAAWGEDPNELGPEEQEEEFDGEGAASGDEAAGGGGGGAAH
jgi:hypothetical protein